MVDNYGDIGVCWRLAQQLAEEHRFDVRLWVDDLVSFSHLCPSLSTTNPRQRFGLVEICHWLPEFPIVDAADVVIEAFACHLPTTYVDSMERRDTPPKWINLEYLSAESWVEGCHRLPSPQSGRTLTKSFFFPGFSTKTGGLLREKNLLEDRAAFHSAAAQDFLRRLPIDSITTQSDSINSTTVQSRDDELRVSLFCYDNAALPELLRCLAEGSPPIRLFTTPGTATNQVAHWLGISLLPGMTAQQKSLSVQALPFLSQSDYDRLLWACDVNFVRGEDSFVRAQWAQKPFIWQIYPQTDNAHLAKLDAFLNCYLCEFDGANAVRNCWMAWNRQRKMSGVWPEFIANRNSIQQHGKAWAWQLDQAGNLADNLVRFVRGE